MCSGVGRRLHRRGGSRLRVGVCFSIGLLYRTSLALRRCSWPPPGSWQGLATTAKRCARRRSVPQSWWISFGPTRGRKCSDHRSWELALNLLLLLVPDVGVRHPLGRQVATL